MVRRRLERHDVDRPVLVRLERLLDRPDLVEQPLVEQLLVRQLLVEQPLVEQPLVEQPLVGRDLVEQQLELEPVVEQLMVLGLVLCLTRPRRVPGPDASGP
jgi:fused signal recognition particle receptor